MLPLSERYGFSVYMALFAFTFVPQRYFVYRLIGEAPVSADIARDDPVYQQKYQNSRYDDSIDVHNVHHDSVRWHLDIMRIYRIYPVCADKEPVGIDTVWSAGHKSDIVLIGDYVELVPLIRQDGDYLIDLVSEDFIQYCDRKCIVLNELVYICEETRRGETSVGGYYSVAALSADREG